MKVNAKHTEVRYIDVEITEEEIQNLLREIPTKPLADELKRRLLKGFMRRITPEGDSHGYFISRKEICEDAGKPKPFLVLMKESSPFSPHDGMGDAEMLRILTQEEKEEYISIISFSRSILERV